jgi:uncharacterized membrane protein YhaH (DUF805 family)
VVELSPVQWAIRPIKKYADFKGRAPRAEYWWFYLGTLIVDRVLSFVDKRAVGDDALLSGTFGLIILVPWIAVTFRRLHDTDRSGWWLLIVIVPILVFLGVAIASAFADGDAPTDNPIAFFGSLAMLGIAGLVLFVFMVLPGTQGPNDYGDDPYGPSNLEEIFA